MSTRIYTSMATLNNVTDDELRQGLLFYGFPNIPVTETTRPLILKKLYSQFTNESKNSSYNELICKRLRLNFEGYNHYKEPAHLKSLNKSEKKIKEHISFKTSYRSFKTKKNLPIENFPHFSSEIRRQKNVCTNIFKQLLASESGEDSDNFNMALSRHAFTPPHKSLYRSQSVLTSCHQLANKIFRRCYENEISSYDNKNMSTSAFLSKVKTISDKIYSFKQTIVSSFLMCMLLILIILIALTYLFTTTNINDSINWDKTQFQICSTNDAQALLVESSLTCIERKGIESAIATTQLLLTLLHKRAVAHLCFDSSVSIYVSAKDFFSQFNQLYSHSNIVKMVMDLHNAEYLINNNLNWGILHVNANGSELLFEDVIKQRKNQGNYFSLKKLHKPLRCTLKRRLQSFFIVVGSASLLGIILLIIRLCYKCMQRREIEKKLVLEELKNKIIKEISYISSRNRPSFERSDISVKDLQEKIIPMKNRSVMLTAWNDTLNYLEMNDNRVQFGISTRNGKEFKTIKWIPGYTKCLEPNLLKLWHSPAFNKTNKIKNPPTSCLKIRQMFDSTEIDNPHLKQAIEDAILEKVGRWCKIFEIQLDMDSCCVYVRCATEKDAGIVHDEINGWWFDKRLVSIKFLRLQRYLVRFPKSSGGPICLLPSNLNNLSMSQYL